MMYIGSPGDCKRGIKEKNGVLEYHAAFYAVRIQRPSWWIDSDIPVQRIHQGARGGYTASERSTGRPTLGIVGSARYRESNQVTALRRTGN